MAPEACDVLGSERTKHESHVGNRTRSVDARSGGMCGGVREAHRVGRGMVFGGSHERSDGGDDEDEDGLGSSSTTRA
jgi:hypothetical protein